MRHGNRTRLAHAIQLALLAGGVLAFSMTAATEASAPHASSGAPAPVQDAGNSSQPTTDENDATKLAAIEVTAQSRKQRAQDVPIALQVVDADDLERHAATAITDVDVFVPGLNVLGEQPTQPRFEMRGIGWSGFGIGTDPAVGVYVDGVYTARSGASLLTFNDVKRVEVLKGPQGTLFGRNAAAGAISIVTNEPGYDFASRFRVRIGNHGQRYGDVLLNLPVSDTMAFRLNLLDNQSDGWVTDAVTGRNFGKEGDWGGRLAWRWDIGDSTQLRVNWQHERLHTPPPPTFGLAPHSDNNWQRAPYPPDPGQFRDPLNAKLYNDVPEAMETRRYDSLTMHLDHYTSWGMFSSITDYRNFNTMNRGDYDGTNAIVNYFEAANLESNHSWYQEFKFSGNTDMASWVAGLSWYKEDGSQRNQTNLMTDSIDTLFLNLGVPTGTPDGTLYHFLDQVLAANGVPVRLEGKKWTEEIRNHLDYTSTAIYGDVIWHLTDRVNLTTGARITRDDKGFAWYNMPRMAPELDQAIDALEAMGVLAQLGIPAATFRQNIVFSTAVGQLVEKEESWTDFSPRVVLDMHFNDDVMGYLSVAKGYKAGGFDSVQIGGEFEPEKVWNVETGIKTVFPEQRMMLNASVYHYRYSNLQTLQLDPNADGSGIPQYVADTSDQDATGAEVAWQWRPVDGLTLHANAAWIDSTYGDKLSVSGLDLSGQPTGVPKLSYALGLQYRALLPYGQLLLSLDHAWRGAHRCNADSRLQGTCSMSPNFSVGESWNQTDARLGWISPSGGLSVALYGKNLSDEQHVMRINNVSASVLGTPFAVISPPRMYGVEFQIRF